MKLAHVVRTLLVAAVVALFASTYACSDDSTKKDGGSAGSGGSGGAGGADAGGDSSSGS
jgi:hypothetical protein